MRSGSKKMSLEDWFFIGLEGKETLDPPRGGGGRRSGGGTELMQPPQGPEKAVKSVTKKKKKKKKKRKNKIKKKKKGVCHPGQTPGQCLPSQQANRGPQKSSRAISIERVRPPSGPKNSEGGGGLCDRMKGTFPSIQNPCPKKGGTTIFRSIAWGNSIAKVRGSTEGSANLQFFNYVGQRGKRGAARSLNDRKQGSRQSPIIIFSTRKWERVEEGCTAQNLDAAVFNPAKGIKSYRLAMTFEDHLCWVFHPFENHFPLGENGARKEARIGFTSERPTMPGGQEIKSLRAC